MEQEIERPFKVLDANLIGQFGLFAGVEVVIHKGTYTSFGGEEQVSIY
jgi:hypothetical protein